MKQLPWVTHKDDLIELFGTLKESTDVPDSSIVAVADIHYDYDGRSRGTGVVKFTTVELAEKALGKVTQSFSHKPVLIMNSTLTRSLSQRFSMATCMANVLSVSVTRSTPTRKLAPISKQT